jgi:hypothetical protein
VSPILAEYEEVIPRLKLRYPGKPSTDWLTAIKGPLTFLCP